MNPNARKGPGSRGPYGSRDNRSVAMKVIRSEQIRYATLDGLRPGDITAEGIVLSRSIFDHTYQTPSGHFEVDSEQQRIAVFAKVEPYVLETLIEGFKAAGGVLV